MSVATHRAPTATKAQRRRVRTMALAPLRVEVAKLRRQTSVLIVGWVLLLASPSLIAALSLQSGTPADTVFGRWVHESGLAIPLVVMGFAGQWVFPVLAGLAGGDLFSAEDRHGTWQLLLTRSVGRPSLFAAKVVIGLVLPLVGAAVLVGAALVAGLALVGTDPIIDLSGSLVPARHGSWLVTLSFLSQLPALLALTSLAILLSVLTRNGMIGVGGPVVVGLLSQLVGLIDLPPLVRQLLPSGGFTAWRLLWVEEGDTRGIVVNAVGSFIVATICLVVAAVVFLRRDVRVR